MNKFSTIIVVCLWMLILFVGCDETHRKLSRMRDAVSLHKDTLLMNSFLYVIQNIDFDKHAQLLTYEDGEYVLIRDIQNSLKVARQQIVDNELPLPIYYEYLLPPVLEEEDYEEWKEHCSNEFSPVTNISRDAGFICDTLNKNLRQAFTFTNHSSYRQKKWTDYKINSSGNCWDMSKIILYPLRALGYASAMDYILAWGNCNGRHSWNTIYHEGKMHPFMGLENTFPFDPFVVYDYNRVDSTRSGYRYPPKIYRKTFSINKEYADLKDKLQQVSDFELFRDLRFVDVTSEYFDVGSMEIEVGKQIEDNILFLSVFNNQKWLPVDAGHLTKDKIVFRNLKKEMLYILTSSDNQVLSSPIILNQKGEMETKKLSKDYFIDLEVEYLNPRIIEYLRAWGNLDNLPTDIFPGLARDEYREKPQKDKLYQLYAFDEGWRFLSESYPKNNQLIFKNIPANGLYILIYENKIISRCFTYENNQLQWW